MKTMRYLRRKTNLRYKKKQNCEKDCKKLIKALEMFKNLLYTIAETAENAQKEPAVYEEKKG